MLLLIIDMSVVDRLFPMDVIDATLLGQVVIRNFAVVRKALSIESTVIIVVLLIFLGGIRIGDCLGNEVVLRVIRRQVTSVRDWSFRR